MSPTNHPDSRSVCVLTGGTSGIGLATALRFAQAGYRLATCGRHADRLAAAAERIVTAAPGTDVLTVVGDFADHTVGAQLIDAAHLKFGQVDVLVNSAAVASQVAIEEMSAEDVQHMLAVNVVSVFATVRAAWPIMRAQQRGTIINVSSLAAIDPFPGFSVYGGSKAWVDTFTRAIAAEGKPHGIVALSVRPGAVDTPMLRGIFPDFPADKTLAASEVAELIWHLCDPAMTHCTGQAFNIYR